MGVAKKLDFVQALRGLAALAVVICHARYNLLNTPSWPAADRYLIWGAGGVDMFFIISGFIMVYTTTNFDGSRDYVVDFWMKRLAKIWPAYMIATFAMIFIVSGGWSYIQTHASHILRSMVFVPITASEPMALGAGQMPLPVGWTLNYEAYFYAIFGLSMLFRRWRWAAMAIWMGLILLALPLALGTFTMHPYLSTGIPNSYAAMMVNPIIWDFIAGMLIAGLYLSPIRFPSERVAWLALMATATLWGWGYLQNVGAHHGIFGWGGYSAVLFLTLVLLSKTVEIKAPRALVALGNMSFTLYVIHEVVEFAWGKYLAVFGHGDIVIGWSFAVLWIGSSIVLAGLTSRFLEKTAHDAMLRFLRGMRHWGGMNNTNRRAPTDRPSVAKP